MTAWQRNVSHTTDPFIFSLNKLLNEWLGWRFLEAPWHPNEVDVMLLEFPVRILM